MSRISSFLIHGAQDRLTWTLYGRTSSPKLVAAVGSGVVVMLVSAGWPSVSCKSFLVSSTAYYTQRE